LRFAWPETAWLDHWIWLGGMGWDTPTRTDMHIIIIISISVRILITISSRLLIPVSTSTLLILDALERSATQRLCCGARAWNSHRNGKRGCYKGFPRWSCFHGRGCS
jgi:hypothetical protein